MNNKKSSLNCLKIKYFLCHFPSLSFFAEHIEFYGIFQKSSWEQIFATTNMQFQLIK